MTITKIDLVERINTKVGLNKKESKEALEILLRTMVDALANGEYILISGFGKFQVREKNARNGRNPATGDDMTLPPRRVVTFKYSQELKKRLNEEN